MPCWCFLADYQMQKDRNYKNLRINIDLRLSSNHNLVESKSRLSFYLFCLSLSLHLFVHISCEFTLVFSKQLSRNMFNFFNSLVFGLPEFFSLSLNNVGFLAIRYHLLSELVLLIVNFIDLMNKKVWSQVKQPHITKRLDLNTGILT